MLAHLQDSGNFEKKEPEAELQPPYLWGQGHGVSADSARFFGLGDVAYRKEIERIVCVCVALLASVES